ncbi:uncharacterized protein LOC101854073 [Aplysia californica]|uniref:Uncharacterized protein LOC101854073 n=1 Tax=Aplysia californica TaxID=6500 RepID=A0ABM0JIF4_APLCA|nr:uncharacterized protein LOC101854073 [Aplysia californica]
MTSSGQGGVKVRYDKEVSAITHNLKEQRVLEKSMQTLRMEQTYSLKLLELDHRVIKARHKKLKEKVSLIKSHLPPEDINKFRELDSQGRMKPLIGSMSLSSAIKIAAASRRLNLNSGRVSTSRREMTQSTLPLPTITVQDESSPRLLKSTSTVSNNTKPPARPILRRSNSVTGVFIDAPTKSTQQTRPESAFVATTTDLGSSNNNNDGGRQRRQGIQENVEFSAVAEANRPLQDNNEPKSIAKDNLSPRGSLVEKQQDTSSTRLGSARPRSHSLFSSHTAAEREARDESLSPGRDNNTRRMSHISVNSIDSNLGENPAEERRRELLEEEGVRAEILAKRTKLFLQEVDEYLEQHPPLQPSHFAFEQIPAVPGGSDSLQRPGTADEDEGTGIGSHRLRFYRRLNRPGDFDGSPTAMPEDKYRQKLLSLWKDMNKCRYLRLPDDKLDLSGINTLVKDQLKLFQTLKNQEI